MNEDQLEYVKKEINQTYLFLISLFIFECACSRQSNMKLFNSICSLKLPMYCLQRGFLYTLWGQ